MADTNPRVALVSGFWGQNIGNAFFNVGGKWILDEVFGEGKSAFIQDQPGYRTFHNAEKGNPPNDVGLLKHLDLDYIVLQGPVLTEHIMELWGPTLEELTRRGTKLLLIGAAFFKFREAELANARKFLTRFRPSLISTRDPRSYEILDSWDLGMPLYNGLDSAFFVPKAYTPFTLHDYSYYTFNFDRYIEPSITLDAPGWSPGENTFEMHDAKWELSIPSLPSTLAHRSKVQAYLGHVLDRRALPAQLNGRQIVRPEHRTNPHLSRKVYQHPNSVASDEPWTYFNVYGNTELTLADRVHACVITLAYGRPAMLFTPSPRAALFDRLGCAAVTQRPVSLDLDYLEQERDAEVAWLREHVG